MKTWKKGALAGVIWSVLGILLYFIIGLFGIGGPFVEEIAPILEVMIFPSMLVGYLPFDVLPTQGGFPALIVFIILHFGGWVLIGVSLYILKENVRRK